MTTTTIAAQANRGRIATPDMDLQLMLRTEVIPAFMEDVGWPSWRRVSHDADVLADEYTIVLPIAMSKIEAAYMGPLFEDEIQYVGDRPTDRAVFQTTTTGIPDKYYLQTGLGQSVLGAVPGWTMVLNCPLSEDRTVRVIGYLGSITGDDYTNEYELDNMLPRHVQPALICGLRRLIYKERLGAGDKRFELEDREYMRWVARLSEDREDATTTREVRMA